MYVDHANKRKLNAYLEKLGSTDADIELKESISNIPKKEMKVFFNSSFIPAFPVYRIEIVGREESNIIGELEEKLDEIFLEGYAVFPSKQGKRTNVFYLSLKPPE